MSVRVWKRIMLTTALLVWGAASQAQMTGGQPLLTSTARQVPPPADPNEPLLAPEPEQVEAPAASRRATRHAQRTPHAQSSQEAAAPVATRPRPHVDRTRGVKRSNETQPRQHERKTKGKPHHPGQKASSVEPKDERRQGGKRGAPLQGKQASANAGQHAAKSTKAAKQRMKAGTSSSKMAPKATEGHVAHHTKPAHQVGQAVHLKRANSASKTRHAHTAAAKASAPVAKKPVRHKHPSA